MHIHHVGTRLACVCLLLPYCCWHLSVAAAQTLAPRNTRLTTTNGLPHNNITGVEQDRAGFIWIATSDGLARYDGRAVKTFRNRPSDTLSLADNKISELLPAPDGTFIVNTESGTVQRFDPATERFTTLLHRQFLDRNKVLINQIQLSADGRHLWGLLPGVRLIDYDIGQKSLRVHDLPALVGSVNQIPNFILAPTGHIYGRTVTGLFQFDTRTGRKRIIPFPFKIDRKRMAGFWSVNRHQVTLGPNGQIAVFGYDVIALYDPVQNQFRTVPIPHVVRADTSQARRLATVVSYGLKTLTDKHLYVGYMNRLYRFDESGWRSGGQLTLLRQSENATGRLVPWLIDGSGVLWVSDVSAGLTKRDVHPLPFGFQPKRKSFTEDLLEQNLGVALPDSFEVWDNDNWPRYTTTDHAGGYLIDPSRVYRYVATNRTLTEVTKFRFLDDQICCKLCLKTGGCSPGGASLIWVYNNRRGLIAVSADETKGYVYSNSQLPPTNVNPAYDAGDIQPIGQSVWVGSQYGLGLFRYDIGRQRYDAPLKNNPKSTNSIPVNSINCMSADPTDSTVLWIGTVGGGLCRLDTRTMTFRRLGEAEGFPNGTIQSIETDQHGMLWCSTNRGLVRVNRSAEPSQTLIWRHFTTDDGLAENQFLRTSSAHLTDGRLVFGTPNGRIIFDPKAIQDSHFEPPVVLTSLLINNKPVDANPTGIISAGSGEQRAILPAPLNTLSELVLDHTQNFLTIAFAGLDYGKAEKLNYRYQLTGVDDDWVTVGTQNTANYTQLAPGHYLFRVNSTMADGRWSSWVKQLRIVITPPFWATWWAYLAYALAFGGLVLGFIRFRTGQIRQQQEIRLKQQEAEQLRSVDEVKNRFFSNITHEFRTPLTLILSPAEKLLQESKHDGPTRQAHNFIHTNAGRLLRLINQLLDMSKLEAKNMTIALGQGDAIGFVEQLAELFRPLATSRGIELQVHMHPSAGNLTTERWPAPAYRFDADKWEKIITNLLSNAFKFTPEGGQVAITIEQVQSVDMANEQLRLTIADTGIGIQDTHLAHIFDRFYQVDGSQTRAYEGTGIGLALVKELTELLGGTITVQSRAGTSERRPDRTRPDRTEAPTGTTFIVTLPIRPAIGQADTWNAVPPAIRLPTALPDGVIDHAPAVSEIPLGPQSSVADNVPLILVVDDNEELRTFIANELAHQYRILTAADGEEAWIICQRELPDVVVLDVMMPRMDGYQLTQAIKSTPATNHIAVVLLTAKAAHESRIMGLEQGADDYLTKPFYVDELTLRLQNLMTHQQNLRVYLHQQLSSPTVAPPEPVLDSFVNQLHLAIESRLDDATFGVDDLAQAASMSRRTLHRKLTITTNLTANEFIRHYRMQRAARLLQTGFSVSDTAYQVGFENPGYFTKVFKQTYQQTPSEFIGE